MPNPLLRIGQQKTSTDPQDRGPIPPVVEHYVGDNHPYRGTEPHGVEDTVDPKDVERTGMVATQEGVTYLPEVEVETPIPVVIRNTYGLEYIQHRVHHWTWDGNTVTQLLPRNLRRTYARILNIGNQTVAVSDSRGGANMSLGYILNAANPFLEVRSQEEFYAWNNGAGGNYAEVQVYEEFTVDLP